MTEGPAEEKEWEKQVAFEKARFEYCAKLYERETERQESLEKKSQFLFSVITLFLGAMFLKMGFLKIFWELIAQKSISAFLIWSIDHYLCTFGVIVNFHSLVHTICNSMNVYRNNMRTSYGEVQR